MRDELVVRTTVSRLVVTIKAPVEIVESVVRDELERHRASARCPNTRGSRPPM